jgi:hypothetical protein
MGFLTSIQVGFFNFCFFIFFYIERAGHLAAEIKAEALKTKEAIAKSKFFCRLAAWRFAVWGQANLLIFID